MTKLYRSFPHKTAGKNVRVFTLFAYGISNKALWAGKRPPNDKVTYEKNFAVEAIPLTRRYSPVNSSNPMSKKLHKLKEFNESVTFERNHSLLTATKQWDNWKFLCPKAAFPRSNYFNPLNTKRRLLYLKTQFVPRSKHFSSPL